MVYTNTKSTKKLSVLTVVPVNRNKVVQDVINRGINLQTRVETDKKKYSRRNKHKRNYE